MRLTSASTKLATFRITDSSGKSPSKKTAHAAASTRVSKLTPIWRKFKPETRDHLRKHKAAFIIVRNALIESEFIVVCAKCKNPLEPLVFKKNVQPVTQPNES